VAVTKLNSDVLANLILLRVSCESDMGLGIDAVRRDLTHFVGHTLSAGEWQQRLDREISALTRAGLVEVSERKVIRPGDGALQHCESFLGQKLASRPRWIDLKNYELIALALAMSHLGRAHIKALGGVRELRHGILQSAYGLPFKRGQSPSALRNSLAGVALEKGFGAEFGKLAKGRVSIAGRTGRLVAAQLLGRPREYGDDRQLIMRLASEKIGASRTGIQALRAAIWQQLAETKTSKPQSDISSDLKMFSDIVHTKAKERAKGWPGNRRAYISHVWNSIRADCPELSLDEGRFKGLLAEAHRAGFLKLINADLRNRKNMADLKASAVNYKNTEWHFIRVDG